jgi:N-carbamoylputrescine amidase
MKKHNITVGMIQQQTGTDMAANMQLLKEKITSCAHKGAQLVVLQELHNTLYFCQVEEVKFFDLAEAVPGPSTAFYGEIARDLGIVLVTSLFEKRASGLFHNTAVVLDKDGSVAGNYRKMHIPDDPSFHEKFYFTPGDGGFHPVHTSVGILGVMVCWDQWYPEAARLMALEGAELLIYPTAIGWTPSDPSDEKQRQLEAWITIQRSHAIANGLPLIAVNRTGFEPDISGKGEGILFWGNSFICGPQGEILVKATESQDEIIIRDIDLQQSEQVRRWWPFLRDRRIDHYKDLTLRYKDCKTL